MGHTFYWQTTSADFGTTSYFVTGRPTANSRRLYILTLNEGTYGQSLRFTARRSCQDIKTAFFWPYTAFANFYITLEYRTGSNALGQTSFSFFPAAKYVSCLSFYATCRYGKKSGALRPAYAFQKYALPGHTLTVSPRGSNGYS